MGKKTRSSAPGGHSPLETDTLPVTRVGQVETQVLGLRGEGGKQRESRSGQHDPCSPWATAFPTLPPLRLAAGAADWARPARSTPPGSAWVPPSSRSGLRWSVNPVPSILPALHLGSSCRRTLLILWSAHHHRHIMGAYLSAYMLPFCLLHLEGEPPHGRDSIFPLMTPQPSEATRHVVHANCCD